MFNLRWHIFLSSALMLLGFIGTLAIMAADPTPAPSTKIKVLILDGFSNHNWKLNTPLLRGILEPTGLFAVSVSTAPPTATAPGWDAWRPKFSDFDVILQTCNDGARGPQWPEEVKTSFADFVRSGGGAFIYHGGNNAFPNWPEYNDIIGLGWRTAAQGVALQISDDEKIVTIPAGTGQNTGHGPRLDVLVHNFGNHPIHEGFPKTWLSPGLEVYYYARGPAINLEVLSWGFDPRTKMNWPLEWTVIYGRGRVYNSTFGHVWADDTQPASLRAADEQTLLQRAIQWLAKRPITVPVPADFPTAEKTSIRSDIPLPK